MYFYFIICTVMYQDSGLVSSFVKSIAAGASVTKSSCVEMWSVNTKCVSNSQKYVVLASFKVNHWSVYYLGLPIFELLDFIYI